LISTTSGTYSSAISVAVVDVTTVAKKENVA